jgi:hypothetical protein
MTSTNTTLAPTPTGSSVDLTHVYCCDYDLALCGLDVTDMPEVPDGTGQDCVVCLDLEEQTCPRCGE